MIEGLAYLVMVLGGVAVCWGLATAAAGRPPGRPQLLFAGAIELAALAQSLIAGVRIALGFRPAELATTIGYLIGILVIMPVAFFWANNERTRYSGIVLAVAGLTVGVMSLRLLALWMPA